MLRHTLSTVVHLSRDTQHTPPHVVVYTCWYAHTLANTPHTCIQHAHAHGCRPGAVHPRKGCLDIDQAILQGNLGVVGEQLGWGTTAALGKVHDMVELSVGHCRVVEELCKLVMMCFGLIVAWGMVSECMYVVTVHECGVVVEVIMAGGEQMWGLSKLHKDNLCSCDG